MTHIFKTNSLTSFFIFLSLLIFSHSSLSEEVVFTGSFTGASGHETSGSVSIIKTAKGFSVVLNDDFDFDGAPDPRVGFGKNGEYDPDSELDDLKSNSGKQTYTISKYIKLKKYDEVYIWCEQFSVPLGVAKIK